MPTKGRVGRDKEEEEDNYNTIMIDDVISADPSLRGNWPYLNTCSWLGNYKLLDSCKGNVF